MTKPLLLPGLDKNHMGQGTVLCPMVPRPLGEYWETNPRSHCPDMMGHIIEWYYNGIAGIRLL